MPTRTHPLSGREVTQCVWLAILSKPASAPVVRQHANYVWLMEQAPDEMVRPGHNRPLAATQLGNAVLAAQAFQNDPDLLLGRIVLARRPSDVLNNLLSWFLRCSGLLSHLRSCERTMNQKLSLIQSTRSVQ